MSEHTEHSRVWPATFALLGLLLAYPFSYAPVVRLQGGWKVSSVDHLTPGGTVRMHVTKPIDGHNLPGYKPIDWLIDNTPLREPLFWWADVCGVGRPFREAHAGWR